MTTEKENKPNPTKTPHQQPAPKQPTEYTKEIGETICGRLAEDENLRSICAEPGMPDVATVSNWISNNGEFRDTYALAREFQAQCIADEVIELADEGSTEWAEKVRANGRVVRGPDRKNLPRYRLRTEVRLVKAHMSHQRVMSNFPTGRMVGKVSLEIPVSAANPSLKQRQRGKAVRQANNGNSAGQPGAREKARADCQGAFRWRSRDADSPAAVIRGMRT